jgi:hypothetical protein
MVVMGHESTVPVTLDEMVMLTAAVARGSRARSSSATCRSDRISRPTKRRFRARCGWSRTAAPTS